jgi:hypothetical protein
MDLHILNLHLQAPLFYARDESLEPFNYDPSKGELLFYFEIDGAQYRSIEPDRGSYLGRLVFGGVLVHPSSAEHGPGSLLELPRGQYLFAQGPEIADREGYIQMAVEVQKEGLWQQLSLDRGLYLRYVYEDEKPHTQVFRPLAESGGGEGRWRCAVSMNT